MIVASVIGGIGTIVGPILGAIVIYVVRQFLQDAQSWSSVVNGILIIVVIRFAPRGLWGVTRDLVRTGSLRLRPPVSDPIVTPATERSAA